jgi:predicted phage terminase large subunit-like protein
MREIADEARSDLLAFIQVLNPRYQVNWHHAAICDRLTRLASEEGQRLIISVPPQYGKSEIVSRHFPAWMLGRIPDGKIIQASYSADLANSFNRDCQGIMESEAYRTIFPQTQIYPFCKGIKRTQNEVQTSRRGYLFTVGVGGATTGRTANPLFIIDDPIKDMVQALNEKHRQRIIEWYHAVVETRLSLGANVIIMHTRWHQGDLAGYLQAEAAKDPTAPQYEVINFPALAEPHFPLHADDPRQVGEALWPLYKGDAAAQQKLRKSVGSYIYNALFQGRPQSEGGNMVDAAWWRYYEALPPLDAFEEMLISVDCAFKDIKASDFVVVSVWGRIGRAKYLVDQIRGRYNVQKTMHWIMNTADKYPRAHEKLIEGKANGPAVISLLKGKLHGLREIDPKSSKISRVAAVSPMIEDGEVWLPDPKIATFDVRDFVAEWSAFPMGVNDDQVDAGTQALDRLSRGENNYLRKLVGRT